MLILKPARLERKRSCPCRPHTSQVPQTSEGQSPGRRQPALTSGCKVRAKQVSARRAAEDAHSPTVPSRRSYFHCPAARRLFPRGPDVWLSHWSRVPACGPPMLPAPGAFGVVARPRGPRLPRCTVFGAGAVGKHRHSRAGSTWRGCVSCRTGKAQCLGWTVLELQWVQGRPACWGHSPGAVQMEDSLGRPWGTAQPWRRAPLGSGAPCPCVWPLPRTKLPVLHPGFLPARSKQQEQKRPVSTHSSKPRLVKASDLQSRLHAAAALCATGRD